MCGQCFIRHPGITCYSLHVFPFFLILLISSIVPEVFCQINVTNPADQAVQNNTNRSQARIYFLNLYTGLPGVQTGSIEYLRVTEASEQPSGRLLGMVPVEEDGSVYVSVPEDVPLLFEICDESFVKLGAAREIIRIPGGRIIGFVGLNDPTDEAPPAITFIPKALLKEPVAITPVQ